MKSVCFLNLSVWNIDNLLKKLHEVGYQHIYLEGLMKKRFNVNWPNFEKHEKFECYLLDTIGKIPIKNKILIINENKMIHSIISKLKKCNIVPIYINVPLDIICENDPDNFSLSFYNSISVDYYKNLDVNILNITTINQNMEYYNIICNLLLIN
jgi:hypothetical protein